MGPQNYMYLSAPGFGGTKNGVGPLAEDTQSTYSINIIHTGGGGGGGAVCPYKFLPDCAKMASSRQIKLSYRASYMNSFQCVQ